MKENSKWLIDRLKANKVLFSDCKELTDVQKSFIFDFAYMAFRYSKQNYIPYNIYEYDMDYMPCESVVVKLEDIYIKVNSIIREDLLVVYSIVDPVKYYAEFEFVIDNIKHDKFDEFRLIKFKNEIMEYIEDYSISEDDFLSLKELIYN